MEINDLINEFYLVKFIAFSNYEFTLASRPWLIYDHYLMVRPWDPNLDPKDMEIDNMAMWIRIPSLPVKVFNHNFLTFLR